MTGVGVVWRHRSDVIGPMFLTETFKTFVGRLIQNVQVISSGLLNTLKKGFKYVNNSTVMQKEKNL